jgi:hypothetical protein
MREVTAIEPKWLTEAAPTFYKVADANKISKRKRQEKIEVCNLWWLFIADFENVFAKYWISSHYSRCIIVTNNPTNGDSVGSSEAEESVKHLVRIASALYVSMKRQHVEDCTYYNNECNKKKRKEKNWAKQRFII